MLKIAYYEFRKIIRDWRFVLIFLSQPIILITLLGLTAFKQPENIAVSVYNKEQNSYSEKIVSALQKEKDLKIEILGSEQAVRDNIGSDKSKEAVIINIAKRDGNIGGTLEVIDNATVPEISGTAKKIILNSITETLTNFYTENAEGEVKQASSEFQNQFSTSIKKRVSDISTQISLLPLPAENLTVLQKSISDLGSLSNDGLNNILIESKTIPITESKNTNKEIKYFDFYASSIIILLIIMIGLNTSSTTITQERIDGTFERFFVTPFTKVQMIFGKMITLSTISIALSVIAIFSLAVLFKVNMGPVWLVLLIAYLSSLVAISLGMLISSFTRTIAESMQVAMLFFFSSLIMTTFIFQPETMHPIIQNVSKIIPFTYSINAMREVNILNFGFFDVWKDLLILFGYIFLFLILAVVLLKRKAD